MWRRFRIVRRRISLKGRREAYLKYKEEARVLVTKRVAHYSSIYGVTPRRIFIKNSKTRWGSCSKNGNLNFHYKIALLPAYLAEYLVAHEVAHLKEFNHSVAFWALIAQEIPEYKKVRKELRMLR